VLDTNKLKEIDPLNVKIGHVAAAAAILLAVSGSAFAAMNLNPGYVKWQRNYDMLLCTDYGGQFKDAVSVRAAGNVPAAAERAAKEGETLCHNGNYANGDQELSKVITKLQLSPSGPQDDAVD
jgi:hypothetical protein